MSGRATRMCTTLLMVYMRLEQLPSPVVVVVFDRLFFTTLPGMFLVMLNMTMDSVPVALGLRGTTDHVFLIVVIVVLK